MTHLWETDHPYYCSESNFYSLEPGQQFDSWEEFFESWGESDKDYNLLFRWDWKVHDPADYDDDGPTGDYLQLFYVLQRKGIFMCNEVSVTREDEPAIREFLQGYWTHMQTLWEPLS